MNKEIRIKSKGRQADLLKNKIIRELRDEFIKHGVKIIDENKKVK